VAGLIPASGEGLIGCPESGGEAPPVPDELDRLLDFGSRAGESTGKYSPATATSTWPVTQTGVWSLDFE
jgi:hypothetical protein